MAFIEIRDLSRTYRTLDGPRVATEQTVFQGFDLDIEAGELVGIVGPSGCGKSTLLNMIGGLDVVSARQVARVDTEEGFREVATVEGGGTIRIGDFEMSSAEGDRKADFMNQHIGFVFQFHHLIPELSALDNVALPRLIGGERRAAARRKARDLLARVDLANHGEKRPAVLSGGEKQRVAIARALINEPPLVLADEPTGSLDPELKGTIFELLSSLNKKEGLTVILITHDHSLLVDGQGRPRTDRLVTLDEARRRNLGGAPPRTTSPATHPGKAGIPQ